MDKMLYVAMTGASQNARAQQAHANNLANISTTGFRRDFEQARSMQVFGDSYPARVYAMSERPGTDFTAGALQETGRDLDVAIEGEGWVAVQAPDGNEAYVRTGSLNIDALGMLRAANGMPVLGNGGPIAIPPEEKVDIGQTAPSAFAPWARPERRGHRGPAQAGQSRPAAVGERHRRPDPHEGWAASRGGCQRTGHLRVSRGEQRQCRCRDDVHAGAVPPVRTAREDDAHRRDDAAAMARVLQIS